MKISSGWKICYCSTRGLTSHCYRGDMGEQDRTWESASQRREAREQLLDLLLLPESRVSPLSRRLKAWHRAPVPEACGILATVSSSPSSFMVNPTVRTREPSGVMSRSVNSAEMRINKICTFQAMGNANGFYSATSVPGVLC